MAGGVGTFAVQIGKALGAEVTGVCSTRNVEMVRSIGADHVVDYTKEDFTNSGQRYDLILDNVGNRSFSDLRRAIAPQGLIIPNSGHGGMTYVFKAFLISAVRAPTATASLMATTGSKDSGSPDGADRIRQDHAGYRPHLPVERDGCCSRLCGRRARPWQSGHHCGASCGLRDPESKETYYDRYTDQACDAVGVSDADLFTGQGGIEWQPFRSTYRLASFHLCCNP